MRAGPNTLEPYRHNPPDRAIGADDIVFCDFGPIFEDWEADFGRTFVLGGDPAKLRLRDALPAVWRSRRAFFTLQRPQVQRSSFGRLLDGAPDVLSGYRADWVTITDPAVISASGSDRHPIVRHTGESRDSVPGIVFTLSPTQLAAADHYEVDDYRRVLARLGSGTDAWVYLAADRAEG